MTQSIEPPMWQLRTQAGGGTSTVPVAVGLGEGRMPAWQSGPSTLFSDPVRWTQGARLAFAVSPSGGAGTDSCETVSLGYFTISHSGSNPSTYAFADSEVFVDKWVNGCTKAQLRIIGANFGWTGQATSNEDQTWNSYKLFQGSTAIAASTLDCSSGIGTGHTHCSIDGYGTAFIIYHNGYVSWNLGKPRVMWSPLNFNTTYTVDSSARAETGFGHAQKLQDYNTGNP